MAATREQVMEALFAVLQGIATFVTSSRRNQDPEGLGPTQTPALFLVEHEDEWDRKQGYNIQAKRTLNAKAIIYIDVGSNPNAIPSSFINNALDALDVAFAPDNRATNAFTLGGLVAAVTIDGTSTRASGDFTGKGLAIVPIRILFP
jgi:hypothetical protein